jgi:FKBP-type peptidyl-prolyl cis-trans isomerase (trigger factor)
MTPPASPEPQGLPSSVATGATFFVRPQGAKNGVSHFWIEQPLEELLEKEAQALSRLQRDVKWPGFRRGSVPIPRVRLRFASEAREQALAALVRESVGRAIKEGHLIPLSPPTVEEAEVSQATIRIHFSVECPPDVDVVGYRGLRLVRRSFPVTEEAVETALREIGGECQSAPSGFRDAVKKILEAEAERLSRRDMESQAVEALLDAHPFDVPPSLARERARELFRRLEAQCLAEGGTPHTWKERYSEYEPTVRLEAERGVRLAYLLAAIAEAEEITISNEEATVAVRKAVQPLPADHQDQTIRRLESKKDDVRGMLLEDKVFDFLIRHAVITPMDQAENA